MSSSPVPASPSTSNDFSQMGLDPRVIELLLTAGAEIDALKVSNTELSQQVSALSADRLNLQTAIEEYEKSSSWRITRPLRALASIIKR